MWYSSRKSQKKWQKTFLKDVFDKKQNIDDAFTRLVINDVSFLKQKENYFPKTICKYYAPTSHNILDVQQQRVWLAHPSSFNDPFDCSLGCDIEEYEKKSLIKYIEANDLIDKEDTTECFTTEEFNSIYNSTTNYELTYHFLSKHKGYWNVLWDLYKKKSDSFERRIDKFRREARKEAETKIDLLRNINIRVACFSEFNQHDGFNKKIQMWSHYAANHKGFCVEFDLSFLKEEKEKPLESHEFYSNPEQYLDEKLRDTIKGCLFPVIYTSSRTNVPVTKLLKLKKEKIDSKEYNKEIDVLLYKAFIIKSANWNYEKEWRLILDGDLSSYFDNKLPFPHMKKIYLGCNMEQQTRNTMIGIAKELNIDVVDLKMDNKKFVLEEQDISIIDRHKVYRKWNNPFS